MSCHEREPPPECLPDETGNESRPRYWPLHAIGVKRFQLVVPTENSVRHILQGLTDIVISCLRGYHVSPFAAGGHVMMGFVRIVVVLLRAFLCSRSPLAAENLALRQQLVVLQRTGQRPKLRRRDRILWMWLSRLWRGWRSALLIVQPRPLSDGIARAFGSTGAGSRKAGPAGRRSTPRSAI